MSAATMPPLLHLVWQRVSLAARTAPTPAAWRDAGLLLLAFALVAGVIGGRTGFLRVHFPPLPPHRAAALLSACCLSPALTEEIVFRAAWLPHPTERATESSLWATILLSLTAFVLYHPVKAWLRPNLPRSHVFRDARFLTLAALLGLCCSAAYLRSGSLWPPVAIHGLCVAVWLGALGGYDRIAGNP